MSFRNSPNSGLVTSQVEEVARVLTVGTTGPTGPTGSSGSLSFRLLTDSEVSTSALTPTLLNNNSVNYIFTADAFDRSYYFTVNDGEYAQLYFKNATGIGSRHDVYIFNSTNGTYLVGGERVTINAIFITIAGGKFAAYHSAF